MTRGFATGSIGYYIGISACGEIAEDSGRIYVSIQVVRVRFAAARSNQGGTAVRCTVTGGRGGGYIRQQIVEGDGDAGFSGWTTAVVAETGRGKRKRYCAGQNIVCPEGIGRVHLGIIIKATIAGGGPQQGAVFGGCSIFKPERIGAAQGKVFARVGIGQFKYIDVTELRCVTTVYTRLNIGKVISSRRNRPDDIDRVHCFGQCGYHTKRIGKQPGVSCA